MTQQPTPATEATRLLKAAEVARKLSISKSMAYKMMQNGEIPTVRFMTLVRVRECDLENFILQNRTNGLE